MTEEKFDSIQRCGNRLSKASGWRKEHSRTESERWRRSVEWGNESEPKINKIERTNEKCNKWKNKEQTLLSYTVDPGEHEKNWEASYRARWDDVEEEANHSEEKRTNVEKKRWKQSDLILDVRCFRRPGAAAAWNVHSNLLSLSVTRSFLVVPKKKNQARERRMNEKKNEIRRRQSILLVWLALQFE